MTVFYIIIYMHVNWFVCLCLKLHILQENLVFFLIMATCFLPAIIPVIKIHYFMIHICIYELSCKSSYWMAIAIIYKCTNLNKFFIYNNNLFISDKIPAENTSKLQPTPSGDVPSFVSRTYSYINFLIIIHKICE